MPPGNEEPYFEEESDPASFEEPRQKEKLMQCRLYRILLEKYADLINVREKRTIGEIKALVNSDDLTVQSIVSDFKNPGYSFEQGYPEAAARALEFVQKSINHVEPEINLNYWLSAKEIFSSKVGDDEDLAVFLCSLLLGLGDQNASVIIAELDSLRTHAFVATEFRGKFFILDASQSHSLGQFSGQKEEAIKKYSFKKARIKRFLYKFNSKNYEQFM